MLPEGTRTSWKAFYDAARHNGILDERTTVLVHLAAALAVGCDP